jgi:hypothetical protein
MRLYCSTVVLMEQPLRVIMTRFGNNYMTPSGPNSSLGAYKKSGNATDTAESTRNSSRSSKFKTEAAHDSKPLIVKESDQSLAVLSCAARVNACKDESSTD